MLTSKNMTNQQIAELLRNVAAAHQLKDETKYKFQIIAYQRAADSVEHATSELKDLWDDGKLSSVPGIGTSISSHLDEIFKTGKSKHFEEITEGISDEVFKLMELPGIGVKTALKMVKESPRSEIEDKLAQVEQIRSKAKRYLLPYAEEVASEVLEWILKDGNITKASVLGSLRRRVATIGDIDIAVASKTPISSISHFTKYPKKTKIIEKGTKTASIGLPGGLSVDLLVTNHDRFGSALQHFTGSKHHNIALREYALKKGYSLSEYGIKDKDSKLKKFSKEENFYRYLGLDYIQPELREDTGEIEAALQHKLPKLITIGDVKADLQIHSDFDIETSHDLGASSMKDVVKKANKLGYEYLAFTEHNPSKSKHNEKQIVEILKRKREKVDQLNYSISKDGTDSVKFVFNSLEIDILPNGNLPLSENALETLDFALVSIHSSFSLNRSQMTKRVIAGLSHSKVAIFAHPTSRKLNLREGIELNWPEIFEFCVKNNKFLEINADPARLDLPDVLVRDATKAGVRLCLGTDSHHSDHMDNMIYGVSVARRGWCERKDIINTLPLEKFKKIIKD